MPFLLLREHWGTELRSGGPFWKWLDEGLWGSRVQPMLHTVLVHGRLTRLIRTLILTKGLWINNLKYVSAWLMALVVFARGPYLVSVLKTLVMRLNACLWYTPPSPNLMGWSCTLRCRVEDVRLSISSFRLQVLHVQIYDLGVRCMNRTLHRWPLNSVTRTSSIQHRLTNRTGKSKPCQDP